MNSQMLQRMNTFQTLKKIKEESEEIPLLSVIGMKQLLFKTIPEDSMLNISLKIIISIMGVYSSFFYAKIGAIGKDALTE